MLTNGIFNRVRLTGMASGLDTDAIIRDLMKAERIPLERSIQQKQLLEWRRDEYRKIYGILDEFNKSYMDVLNSSSNMRSELQYKKFVVSVTGSNGLASGAVSADGTPGTVSGTHTIIVKDLATAASSYSVGRVTAALTSGDIRGELNLAGKKLRVSVDGITKEIEFSSDYVIDSQESGDAFASDFEALITRAFGTGINGISKVSVQYDDLTGKLRVDTAAGANNVTLINETENNALADLGFANQSSNRISTSAKLSELADRFMSPLTFYNDNGEDKIRFSINGREFTFTSDTRLSSVLNTINSSDAGVNISYDGITDRFKIEAKETGAGRTIKIENTWGNFFGAGGAAQIDHTAAGFGENGKDAVVILDGEELTRRSNSFTESGVTFNLEKADPNEEITINLALDIDGIYDSIKSFVDAYNTVLDKLMSKLYEKYDRDYPPLTDEQKDALSEDEIKKWEEKAKTGLLQNDSLIRKIVDEMRMKMLESVEGTGISLYSIGISSKSYLDRGKLSINEQKLKNAIANDVESVMGLFCKQSESHLTYSRKLTAAERAERFSEEGIVNRLYDIIQDNISAMTDSGKRKGSLLEKAGLVGDSTDYSSELSRQIRNADELIAKWEERLAEREEYYLRKFTKMETALSKLYSQSNWLASQFTNSGGNR